jgi:hypothetical protein
LTAWLTTENSFAGDVDLALGRSTIERKTHARAREATMQYMLLIYDAEGRKLSPAEQGQLMQEYMAFTQGIVKDGKFKAGDPLEPTSTATTVRVRNAKTLTTDGPFAETKEQLGGYYIVEAENLDEAVSIAARIPGARTGSIEVRPVMKMHM